MKTIIEKLLSIGGKKVLVPESLSENILDFAHLYDYKVLIPPGGASRYFLNHENEVRIIWGFVLTDEEIWVMHSWLIDQRYQVIIDNYCYREYFGFLK